MTIVITVIIVVKIIYTFCDFNDDVSPNNISLLKVKISFLHVNR